MEDIFGTKTTKQGSKASSETDSGVLCESKHEVWVYTTDFLNDGSITPGEDNIIVSFVGTDSSGTGCVGDILSGGIKIFTDPVDWYSTVTTGFGEALADEDSIIGRGSMVGDAAVDSGFAQGYVDVQGAWDSENNVYRTETKNAGSKRLVYFDPDGRAAEVLKWILDYSNKKYPASDYVVAATRGNNPLSNFMFRKVVYATYEQLGLAKLEWHRSNSSHKFRIIWSPFKDCASKTWRHLKAAQLIQERQRLELSDNYIKKIMGHDLYSTTRDIYGDHDLLGTEEHHKIAAKIEAARNKQVKLIN